MTRPNGQTLVLFALTLLLMTLLVLMTLSFGSKVKSRMEVQTVADATAYSNAVVAARTMNAISVMNRVHVAHTVSTIGTLSLISYVTLYWRHAQNGATLWIRELIAFVAGLIWCICPGPTCRPPACRSCIRGIVETGIAAFLMTREANRVKGLLQNDTVLFQNETTPRWLASAQIHADQVSMINTYKARTNAGTFATTYAGAGNLRGVTPLGAPSTLNDQEAANAIIDTPAGPGLQPYHASIIVNGSRGHPFMPRRSPTGSILGQWAKKLSWPWVLIAAGWVFTDGNEIGRGYLNSGWTNFIGGPNQGHPFGTWANDRGGTTRALLIKPFGPMCTIFGAVALAVGLLGKSTGAAEVGPFQHTGIHNVQHSYYTFPPFIDYNPGGTITDTDDIYAQPKNLSMVSANPSARNDPWETKGNNASPGLTFHASQSTGGASFDMVNEPASHTNNMQNAVGSGVTYYSRPDHFTEPPNLFAPYWRSGLTRMTVDRPAAGPARGAYDNGLKNMFNASGQGEAGVTFQELVNAGYKGFE